MKKIIKALFLILFVFFSITFFSRNQNYYESNYIIDDAAISRFEKDLASGREIIPANYITPRKNYSNIASRLGLRGSRMIKTVVNKMLRKLLNYMST